MKLTKDVKMRLLFELDNKVKRIGNLIINRRKGDIYYIPSSKEYLENTSQKREIVHFSWHESGEIHLKLKVDPYKKIRKGLKIKEIGFQDLFRDLIVEPVRLPIFSKRKDTLDVVFKAKEYKGPILLTISIISGKLLVRRYKGEETPLNFVDVSDFTSVLGLEKRALGFESGNSDKFLQIALLKTSGDSSKLRTKRRILVLPDQKIDNK